MSNVEFIHDESNLDNLPVMGNSDNWYQFESIDVPILTFSGSLEEDNYLHLDMLEEKALGCNDFVGEIIEAANHFYMNREDKVSSLVLYWIKSRY